MDQAHVAVARGGIGVNVAERLGPDEEILAEELAVLRRDLERVLRVGVVMEERHVAARCGAVGVDVVEQEHAGEELVAVEFRHVGRGVERIHRVRVVVEQGHVAGTFGSDGVQIAEVVDTVVEPSTVEAAIVRLEFRTVRPVGVVVERHGVDASAAIRIRPFDVRRGDGVAVGSEQSVIGPELDRLVVERAGVDHLVVAVQPVEADRRHAGRHGLRDAVDLYDRGRGGHVGDELEEVVSGRTGELEHG